jgi:trimeric autotransporter adhesin
MNKYYLTILFVLIITFAIAQNVGIGTSSPNASAQLDIASTTKGFLTPRMTKTQKNAITAPATSLLVYQTSPDSTGFHYYTGTGWQWLEPVSTNAWKTTGNTGTDPEVNFIGNIDNQPIRFKQNNQWMGRLDRNSGNYFLGLSAGVGVTLGTKLIGIGSLALTHNTTGTSNIALGDFALSSNSIGGNNIAMGTNALDANISGASNIAIGSRTLLANSTGGTNTAIGGNALEKNTTGNQNISIGYSSSGEVINGYANTVIGYAAMNNSQSNVYGSTAIGAYALSYNGGGYNTALGHSAMFQLSDGNENIAIGRNAMYIGSTSTGDNNIAIGSNAMNGSVAISGGRNIGIGGDALQYVSSGDFNVAVGHFAAENNTTGQGNVAIGYVALAENTNGSDNVAMGDRALHYRSGSGNVAIGKEAGGNLYTGYVPASPYIVQQNTLLGYRAGQFLIGSGNVFIGYNAGATIVDTSNILIIHNSNTTSPLLSGNFTSRIFKTQGVLQVADSSVFFNAVGNVPISAYNPPQTGVGRRTMWYADKAAFRTGYVTSVNWDKDSIGNYSFASGNNTKAKGISSVAFGTNAEALTLESFAMGNNAIASGLGARAMGLNVTASGDAATAIGYSNTSSGTYAIALGSSNTASALNSTTTGNFNIASGDYSSAHGRFLKSKSYAGFVIGAYNDTANAASTTSYNADNRIFQVGNGFSDALRNNAFTILQSGLTGINTELPKTGLDINADLAYRQKEVTIINGVNNDVAPSVYSFIKINGPTAAFSISGFSGGIDGKILTVLNLTGQNMTIVNQTSSTSLAVNRINTLTGVDYVTVGNGSVTMQYSAADNRWMVIATRD